MKTSKVILSVLTVIISCSLACPVFADWVSGGNWSYGGYHNPGNWGAFSNYFHDYRWHWSSVARASDSKANVGYASAHYTSRAFINTSFGENAYFNYGF